MSKSKSKSYTPQFRGNDLNPEYRSSSKKNPANFSSEFNKIDHVATSAHRARIEAQVNIALQAETGRSGSNSFLKSI